VELGVNRRVKCDIFEENENVVIASTIVVATDDDDSWKL